jgi:hypothetical protein
VLWIVLLLSAGIIAYSQTAAWFGDEGFDLLASFLIGAGKRPYLDFFYQHAPLWAYANAAWMKVFGENWRSAHLFSALCSAAGVALAGRFLLREFADRRWKVAAASTAAVLAGLDTLVLRFGTLGQAYGLSLLCLMIAFLLAVGATGGTGWWRPAVAGLFAAAASTALLLALPALPVLLTWLWQQDQTGDRRRRCAAFLIGAGAGWLPLAGLFVLGPRQTFFNVVLYHLRYRTLHVPGPFRYDVKELLAWTMSTQGMLEVLLCLAGLLFLAGGSEAAGRRSVYRLCAWLVASLGLLAGMAHPTGEQYFVLTIPFVAILATVGVYAIGTRLGPPLHPAWLVIPLLGLFSLPVLRMLPSEYRRAQRLWPLYEQVGRIIDEVTPPGAPVAAGEFFLFAARRFPTTGQDNRFARKLHLPASTAAALHIVTDEETDRWIAEGRFYTLLLSEGDERLKKIAPLYAGRRKVENLEIFYGRREPSTP